MKKLFLLVVMLCTVMISSTAAAADWKLAAFEPRIGTIFIDPDSGWDISNFLDMGYRGYYVQALFKIFYNDAGRNALMELRRSSGLPITPQIQNASYSIALLTFKSSGNGIQFNVSGIVFFTSNGRAIPEMSDSVLLNELISGNYAMTSDQYFDVKYWDLINKGSSAREAKAVSEKLAQRYQADRVSYLQNLFHSVGKKNGAINPFGLYIIKTLSDENPLLVALYVSSYSISMENFTLTNNSTIKSMADAVIESIASQIAKNYNSRG